MRTKTAKIPLKVWRDKGHHFSFRGKQVFYRVSDDNTLPPLLLVHGFPTCSWDWNMIWEELEQHFFLIAPDMLGFGLSEKPVGHNYTIAEQAFLCEQLCELLNIKHLHVLAHDYGDTVTQELISRANEHACSFEIESVILLNGGLFPETHRPVLMQKLLLSPLGRIIARLASFQRFKQNFANICHNEIPEEDLETYWSLLTQNNGIDVMPKLIRYMTERKQYRERWVGALQQTKIPILLVNGVEDPISGSHMVERYQELIPKPKVSKLASVGHYPQLEAPERVLNVCQSFWKGIHAFCSHQSKNLAKTSAVKHEKSTSKVM